MPPKPATTSTTYKLGLAAFILVGIIYSALSFVEIEGSARPCPSMSRNVPYGIWYSNPPGDTHAYLVNFDEVPTIVIGVNADHKNMHFSDPALMISKNEIVLQYGDGSGTGQCYSLKIKPEDFHKAVRKMLNDLKQCR